MVQTSHIKTTGKSTPLHRVPHHALVADLPACRHLINLLLYKLQLPDHLVPQCAIRGACTGSEVDSVCEHRELQGWIQRESMPHDGADIGNLKKMKDRVSAF